MINRCLFDLSFLKLFEVVSEIPLSSPLRLFGIVPIRHYDSLFMVAFVFGRESWRFERAEVFTSSTGSCIRGKSTLRLFLYLLLDLKQFFVEFSLSHIIPYSFLKWSFTVSYITEGDTRFPRIFEIINLLILISAEHSGRRSREIVILIVLIILIAHYGSLNIHIVILVLLIQFLYSISKCRLSTLIERITRKILINLDESSGAASSIVWDALSERLDFFSGRWLPILLDFALERTDFGDDSCGLKLPLLLFLILLHHLDIRIRESLEILHLLLWFLITWLDFFCDDLLI